MVASLILHQYRLTDAKRWEVSSAGAQTLVVRSGAPAQSSLPPGGDVTPRVSEISESAQRGRQGVTREKVPELATQQELCWRHAGGSVRCVSVLEESAREPDRVRAAVGADVVAYQSFGGLDRDLCAAVSMWEGHRG